MNNTDNNNDNYNDHQHTTETHPLLAGSRIRTMSSFDDDYVDPILGSLIPATTASTSSDGTVPFLPPLLGTSSSRSTTPINSPHRRGFSLNAASFLQSRDNNSNNRSSHRRSMTFSTISVTELFERTSVGIRTIADEINETAVEVSNAFVSDVEASNNGQRYFLDMQMTRSLSILPENLSDFLDESIEALTPRVRSHTRKQYLHQKNTTTAATTRHHHPLLRHDERPINVLPTLSSTTTLADEDDVESSSASTLLLSKRALSMEGDQRQQKQQSHEEEEEDDDSSSGGGGNQLSAYIGLLLAVLAVSSNGTALSLLHGVNPCIKLFWRMSATALFLSFFAIHSIMKEIQQYIEIAVAIDPTINANHNNTRSSYYYGFKLLIHEKMNMKTSLEFGGAVICFTAHVLLLFNAYDHTTIGNTVIFANSQALLLIIGKIIIGESVLWIEMVGVIIAFSGAILCSVDSDFTPGKNGTMDVFQGMYGDALALGSAITGVVYLTFAKAVRTHINVTVFMFLVMLLGSVLVILFMLVSGIPFQWNNHPIYGLFGWLTIYDNHLYILVFIALICNVCGTMGFVRAMKYFDNLIITVATLLEPMIASYIAYLFHVGPLPGVLGWTGNVLVALGTLGVVYPSIKNSNNKGGDVGGGH